MAVSYNRNNQTVQPNQWGADPGVSLTLKSDMTHPNARKWLAIVWAVVHLQPYLEGHRRTIRTEHDALKWKLNLADSMGRFAQWRLRFSEFDFRIVHHAGIRNHKTDAIL